MAKSLGRDSTLEVSLDGVTYVPVENHMDADVDHGEEDTDAHTNDSGGFKDYEQTWQQVTLTAKLYADIVAGLNILRDGQRAKTNLYWRVRERGVGSGRPELTFRGLARMKKGMPSGGLHTLNLTVKSKGTVTSVDQA